MSCRAGPKQANKKTCKQFSFSAPQFPAHLTVPGLTQRKLRGQLKSNDHKLRHDSSTDRLFPIRLGIGLRLTEKSTDSRRPAVEDVEVSFSKSSRLSYSGLQHSADITCSLCEASLQLRRAQHLSSAAACVGVSFRRKHTLYYALNRVCKKHQVTNMSNVHFTVVVNSKATKHTFSTRLTFSTPVCLIAAAVRMHAGSVLARWSVIFRIALRDKPQGVKTWGSRSESAPKQTEQNDRCKWTLNSCLGGRVTWHLVDTLSQNETLLARLRLLAVLEPHCAVQRAASY